MPLPLPVFSASAYFSTVFEWQLPNVTFVLFSLVASSSVRKIVAVSRFPFFFLRRSIIKYYLIKTVFCALWILLSVRVARKTKWCDFDYFPIEAPDFANVSPKMRLRSSKMCHGYLLALVFLITPIQVNEYRPADGLFWPWIWNPFIFFRLLSELLRLV